MIYDNQDCAKVYMELKEMKNAIRQRDTSILIHKDIIDSLIREKQQVEAKLSDQLLITQQIEKNYINESNEVARDYESRISDLKDKLDHKEYLLQCKEAKWSEFEKIIVNYVKDDLCLRDKLDEIRYV